MSCATINQSAIQLDVSVASLPEGFCPSSMQELANAIGARIIISPSATFNTFAIGSTAPTSNVGPWYKDCAEWFTFDDATATYIPIVKGGFNTMQYVTANTTFVVPDFIYKLKIHAFGAGGGGSDSSGAGVAGSGGGGGSYGLAIVTVVPGQSVPIVIGTGGMGGAAGSAGGSTTILGRTAGGGAGAASVSASGLGGTAVGFDVNLRGGAGMANSGATSNDGGAAGGDAGGWGGKGGAVMSNSVPIVSGREGTSPGGGGSGGAQAASSIAGAGANGAVLLEW